MKCAVCGGSITKGQERAIVGIDQLAGQACCPWCGDRLADLWNGRLPDSAFENFLSEARLLRSTTIPDQLRQLLVIRRIASGSAVLAEDARLRQIAQAMPVTSGFNFEGFRIVRYLDFLSTETVLGMGLFRSFGAGVADFFGTEARGLRTKLSEAKDATIAVLRRDVARAGGNAIIGIDLDYTMFGDSLLGVVASGTAVEIAQTPH